MTPAYVALQRTGALAERAEAALQSLATCALCPRACGVDRLADQRGYCRTGRLARVSSANAHFGEEQPLVGRGGSGTIFFTNCNLGCLHCQNYDISHLGHGHELTAAELARVMLGLQQAGCENVNCVTPTHVLPQILEAVALAAPEGLRLPLVWNCGGYESVEALRLLDGIVDIYMPDAKYADPEVGQRLSAVQDYPERMRAALAEMHRQVGDLEVNGRGVAERGLLVRHLVLPEGLAGTEATMQFLAGLSPRTYVNVMGQYHPCYRAAEDPRLRRSLSAADYEQAVQMALDAGLTRLDERHARRLLYPR